MTSLGAHCSAVPTRLRSVWLNSARNVSSLACESSTREINAARASVCADLSAMMLSPLKRRTTHQQAATDDGSDYHSLGRAAYTRCSTDRRWPPGEIRQAIAYALTETRYTPERLHRRRQRL